MRHRKITPYCTCGHALTSHMLQEDVNPDGKADATCCRCSCQVFYYDPALTQDKDEMAYEQYLDQKYQEWKDRR